MPDKIAPDKKCAGQKCAGQKYAGTTMRRTKMRRTRMRRTRKRRTKMRRTRKRRTRNAPDKNASDENAPDKKAPDKNAPDTYCSEASSPTVISSWACVAYRLECCALQANCRRISTIKGCLILQSDAFGSTFCSVLVTKSFRSTFRIEFDLEASWSTSAATASNVR